MSNDNFEKMREAVDKAYCDFVSGLFRNYIDAQLDASVVHSDGKTPMQRFEAGLLMATKARAGILVLIDSHAST